MMRRQCEVCGDDYRKKHSDASVTLVVVVCSQCSRSVVEERPDYLEAEEG